MRKRSSRVVFTVVGLAAALAVAACSGDGGEVPTPTAPAPPILGPRLLVLTDDDLPSGFILAEEQEHDNRTTAREHDNPSEALQRFDEWGRVDGYSATFTNPSHEDEIYSRVSVYRTLEGASDGFHSFRGSFLAEYRQILEDAGFEIITLRNVEGPAIGDESFVVHVRFSGQVSGTVRVVDTIASQFRKGNVLAGVAWRSIDENVLPEDVYDLARRQEQLIDNAISAARAATATPTAAPTATAIETSEEVLFQGVQRGNSLWVQVHGIEIKDAVYYEQEDVSYVIRPSDPTKKLAVVDASVGNNRSTTVLMDVRGGGYTLLAEGGNEYQPISPFEASELDPNPPLSEPRRLFIWGNFEIPRDFAIRAWALFEVPEDVEPTQFRWDTVETVVVRNQANRSRPPPREWVTPRF